MKKNYIFICLITIFTLSSTLYAVTANIQGQWAIDKMESKVNILQRGDSVSLKTTFTYFGQQVQWEGEGKIKGNNLTFKYHYTKNRPAGFENGTMFITIHDQMMTGKWISDSKKFSDKITFVKVQNPGER